MKKILVFIICIGLILTVPVGAANDYSSVNIEIQIGSYVAYVNGETKACEAPFLQGGLTFAPVNLLSCGFGIESGDSIIYNGAEMRFTEGSNVVTLNGKEEIMPAPAVKRNETLMVPVRFVCNLFDALIEYEDATGIVKINKSADYSDIFGKPVNGYWCNQDYGWMINLSTDFDLRRQEYDGSSAQFYNSNATAIYAITIAKSKYKEINQVKAKILSESVADVVTEQEIVTLNCGTKAFYIEYEGLSSLYTVKDGLLFSVEFVAASDTEFNRLKNEAKKSILSFCFNIDYAKNPENISELNEGGYTTVADKFLGFSVNKMNSWTELDSIARNITVWKSINHKLLTDFKDDEFYSGEMRVTVYTKEADDTVESFIKKEKTNIKNRYNENYLKNITEKDVLSKEINGKQIDFELIMDDRIQINKVKFFIYEDYIYRMEYYIVHSHNAKEEYIKFDEVERMFDSIKITGVKASRIGNIVNVKKHINENIWETFENQYQNISVDIPAIWNVDEGAYSVEGVEPEGKLEFYAEVLKGETSLEKAEDKYGENLGKAVKTKFMGKTAYKYETEVPLDNGNVMCIEAYLFIHKGDAICIMTGVQDVYKSTYHKDIINKIVKSIRLL